MAQNLEKDNFSTDGSRNGGAPLYETYNNLLRKRGLERHRQSRAAGKMVLIPQEEGGFVNYEDVRIKLGEIGRGIESITSGGQTEIEDREGEDQILERAIEQLNEKIRAMASEEEIRMLKQESFKRLYRFMKARRRLLSYQEESRRWLKNLMIAYHGADDTQRNVLIGLIIKAEELINSVEKALHEFTFRDPESFLASCLLELRQYKSQLPSGIVETEYPRSQKERARAILAKNRLVALVGETGTGKTLIARKMAQEMSPDGQYEFVAGYRFITAEDLFYYRGLDVRQIEPSEVPRIIQEEIEKFNREHPDLPEEEKLIAAETIRKVVEGQIANKELVTRTFLSPVLRAAKEGRIVIIDEFNYIPPSLLGGLNALVEARPGQKINVLGEKIEVKPGFGIILTGNITRTVLQERYLQREKMDPAMVNRLNSGLIEYGSLPQTNKAFLEAIISQRDFKEGSKPIPHRELFQVGLAILADEKGNIVGPPVLLERVWSLAEEFSLFQKLYGGESLETDVKLEGGRDVVLKEYAISMRTFRSVLEAWRGDGYRYSLDWYIYDNLIRPASVVAPSEAGQILAVLRGRGLFFQDSSWDILKVDSITFRIGGIEEIERDRRGFREAQRLKGGTHFFLPQEVAEAFYGVEMPEPLETEEALRKAKEIENIEMAKRTEKEIDEIEANISEYAKAIDLYCEDEEAILGSQ